MRVRAFLAGCGPWPCSRLLEETLPAGANNVTSPTAAQVKVNQAVPKRHSDGGDEDSTDLRMAHRAYMKNRNW